MRRGKGHKSKNGLITGTRRIVKCGASFYVSIPPEFMKRHRLQKGDSVPIIADSILKIIPMQEIE